MPGVGAPMISVVAGQPEGLEQRFELQKDGILPPPKDVCQHGPTMVMLGSDKARSAQGRVGQANPQEPLPPLRTGRDTFASSGSPSSF